MLLQRFIALLDVEDVHLRLGAMGLRWRLLGAQALGQQLVRHYTWSLAQARCQRLPSLV